MSDTMVRPKKMPLTSGGQEARGAQSARVPRIVLESTRSRNLNLRRLPPLALLRACCLAALSSCLLLPLPKGVSANVFHAGFLLKPGERRCLGEDAPLHVLFLVDVQSKSRLSPAAQGATAVPLAVSITETDEHEIFSERGQQAVKTAFTTQRAACTGYA